MAGIGELAVSVVARTGGFNRGLSKASNRLNSFSSQVQAVAGRIRMMTAAGMIGGATFAVKMAADMESLSTRFGVLVGDVDLAAAKLKEIRDFAKSTPYNAQQLIKASETMMAFGVSAEDVVTRLKTIGDIAGADAQRLQSLSLSFGQMTSAGRLMGQDLLQMINAGFNPLQEIAKRTGKSIFELKKEMESGLITTEMVNQAFIDATSEGGRFNGMMEKTAETLNGKLNKLWGTIQELAAEVGEHLIPILKAMAERLIELLEWYGSLSDSSKSMITWTAGITGAFITLAPAINTVIGLVKALTTANKALAASNVAASLTGAGKLGKGAAAARGGSAMGAGGMAGLGFAGLATGGIFAGMGLAGHEILKDWADKGFKPTNDRMLAINRAASLSGGGRKVVEEKVVKNFDGSSRRIIKLAAEQTTATKAQTEVAKQTRDLMQQMVNNQGFGVLDTSQSYLSKAASF